MEILKRKDLAFCWGQIAIRIWKQFCLKCSSSLYLLCISFPVRVFLNFCFWVETQPRDHGGSWLPPTPPLPYEAVRCWLMLSFRPAVWSFPHLLHCWATAAEEAVLGRLPSLHTPCPLCCLFPCCPSRCLTKYISSAVAFLGDPLASFSVKKGKEAEREEGAAGDGEWQPTVAAQSAGPRWRWTAGTSAPSLSRLLLFIWGAAARGGRGARSQGRLLLPAWLLLVAWPWASLLKDVSKPQFPHVKQKFALHKAFLSWGFLVFVLNNLVISAVMWSDISVGRVGACPVWVEAVRRKYRV